jgi:flagellar secretion chaperone FliS
MSRMHAYAAQYRDNRVVGSVTDADQHRLIALLLAGASERVRIARGAIDRGDTQRKGEAIRGANGILEGLRITLNHEAGGEIAAGLDALYEYAGHRLLEANLDNDTRKLDEVVNLLGEIESAWAQIPKLLAGSR